MKEIISMNKPTTGNYYGSDSAPDYRCGYVPIKTGRYRIEIDSVIEEVSQFSSAIQVLDMAEEEDFVEVMLQTPGGNVNATDAFIHAIRKCKAPVHIVATGGVHSAGTHILLEADSFELSAGFNAVCHCGSDGSYGNVNEYHAKADFDRKFRVAQFKATYEGFLTEKEMDDMLGGKDIWCDADEWVVRAQARYDHFKKKAEDANKPAKKARKQKVVVAE